MSIAARPNAERAEAPRALARNCKLRHHRPGSMRVLSAPCQSLGRRESLCRSYICLPPLPCT
eukprot:9330819-Pyramimonas_sp.AAC.2